MVRPQHYVIKDRTLGRPWGPINFLDGTASGHPAEFGVGSRHHQSERYTPPKVL